MLNRRDIVEPMAWVAQGVLDLAGWGFRRSASLMELSNEQVPTVIFDSEWCRLQISFSEWVPPYQTTEYAIHISYGRLHAPNEESKMIWNGEECWCWHSVSTELHFIDGRTPEYTAKDIHSHRVLRNFRETTRSADFPYKLVEWEARKHAYIWKHYARRLFRLFDLRRPELWEKYRQFLKEVYDIAGRNPYIKPSKDKVC